MNKMNLCSGNKNQGCWIDGKKNLYIRNVLTDLWKVRKKATIFVAFCVLVAVCLSFRPGTPMNLSEDQKKELLIYSEQLEEYDAAIRDLEAGIADNEKQIDDLQNYIQHSIYMQIKSDNIQTATIQYGLQAEGNAGNILNSFITYINDGGLRESVQGADMDLQPEYWRDIINVYASGNVLNVTVIHYDAGKCSRILDIVNDRIQKHVSEVQSVQGQFTLTEMEITQFVKADAGVMNAQNGHRNNLKNYEVGLADLKNRLITYRNNRENYINDKRPSFVFSEDEFLPIRILKYLLVGILIGIVVSCSAVVLRYILSDRLRSAEDLRDSGLNVLGICKIKGEDIFYHPEPVRAAMDVRILAESKGKDAVFLDLLHEDELSKKTKEAFKTALKETGMEAKGSAHVMDSAEELKAMIETGSCLMLAEAGKTTYRDLKQHVEICERYQIVVLGCVVME